MNELGNHDEMKVDVALRDYFRSEMPDPWPTMKTPERENQPRRAILGGFFRHAGRIALAASIILLLMGYLALSSMFPVEQRGFTPTGPNIGFRPDGKDLERHERAVPMSEMPHFDMGNDF